MDSSTIRKKFLEFFKDKGHKIVASAPLIIKDDPTLMFTNAGMNQFKDYFLGNQIPESKRVADTQKCLRVSGKHNDLEEVGIDTYHHTMFEMLGNWSFGDYFKKEAIQWSWQLLTEVYGLDPTRLYATVFGGDEALNMTADTESAQLWKQYLPESQILFCSKKDNFWEMGDTGPCGPCTEIHIDLRDDDQIALIPGAQLVNKDNPEVIEIWNNVFMEFNRLSSAVLQPLPQKHVDTGMGFERLCMAVQGKKSNYDTDVFQPLIGFIAQKSGKIYGQNLQTDIAMRVLADHIRAIAFAIADGQLPSNNKAGYVIRRILRRAVRYAYTHLQIKHPFLYTLVPILSAGFEGVFDELSSQKDFVAKVIEEEESSFLRTLESGLKRLEILIANEKSGILSGNAVFELYDTYGFPADLTAVIASENKLQIDLEGFETQMQAQKQRSRAAADSQAQDWIIVNAGQDSSFVGYDKTQSESQIIKYRQVSVQGKELLQIVLAANPFYAESGGQIGDTGLLKAPNTHTAAQIRIIDTQKENNLALLIADAAQIDTLEYLCKLDNLEAIVNKQNRNNISAHHSATHLLHAALRRILGSHVEQRGSLVSAQILRFDFSHFSKISSEDLVLIENLVNEKVFENIALQQYINIPIAQAKEMGAMALFGEKYGENVRVIVFDQDYSVELCGGTHVKASGNIGFFKIISETAIASGIRRIEAVAGTAALEHVRIGQNELLEAKNLLKTKDLQKSILALKQENQSLASSLDSFKQLQIRQIKSEIIGQIINNGGNNILVAMLELDPESIKTLSFELGKQFENLFLVIGSINNQNPILSVMISKDLAQKKGLNAGKLINTWAAFIEGSGGGQPFYATAGGKNKAGLSQALEDAKTFGLGI